MLNLHYVVVLPQRSRSISCLPPDVYRTFRSHKQICNDARYQVSAESKLRGMLEQTMLLISSRALVELVAMVASLVSGGGVMVALGHQQVAAIVEEPRPILQGIYTTPEGGRRGRFFLDDSPPGESLARGSQGHLEGGKWCTQWKPLICSGFVTPLVPESVLKHKCHEALWTLLTRLHS